MSDVEMNNMTGFEVLEVIENTKVKLVVIDKEKDVGEKYGKVKSKKLGKMIKSML